MIIKSIYGETLIETPHRTVRETLEFCAAEASEIRNADLRRAKLTGATLDGLRAPGANFWGADLTGADMGYADLSGADFRNVSFKNACLCGSDFTRADLRGAYFSGTLLEDALFEKAVLSCPSFFGCGLSALRPFSAIYYRHKGEEQITLKTVPIIIEAAYGRMVVLGGKVLEGGTLIDREHLPLFLQKAIFMFEAGLQKEVQAERVFPAKPPFLRDSDKIVRH
jgi:uncharacterized protein YjbI with pentapeptide repeats